MKYLFKFIIAGLVNTIFGAGIMFVLYNIVNINYWASSAANYVFGSILSFFLNKYWTFQVKHWSLYMVIAFILNIVVCYIAAYGIAKPIISYFLNESTVRIRENIALITGMCLFTGLNYLGQRFIVFKKDK